MQNRMELTFHLADKNERYKAGFGCIGLMRLDGCGSCATP